MGQSDSRIHQYIWKESVDTFLCQFLKFFFLHFFIKYRVCQFSHGLFDFAIVFSEYSKICSTNKHPQTFFEHLLAD